MVGEAENEGVRQVEKWDFSSSSGENEVFAFDDSFGAIDPKARGSPALEVKELDELPEQWRRGKIAWLCKELPAHKPAALIRILNAQRKWVTQEDVTYVAVHCMRIRENETGFKVNTIFHIFVNLSFLLKVFFCHLSYSFTWIMGFIS